MGIRAVFFDLGKVILSFEHQTIIDRLLIRRPDAQEVRQALFGLLFDEKGGLCNLYDRGDVSSEEFHSEIDRQIPLGLTYAEFADRWNGIFTELTGVSGLMRGVRARRPVYLLSNVNELHWEHALGLFPVLGEMDGWVLSYKVRARKPEKEIFDAALRLSNTPPEETLFIDDLEANTNMAGGMGINTITFTGPGPLESELSRLGLI